MQDKTLLKIAMAVAIIGIIGLFFVSGNIGLEETMLDKIDEKDIDETVKVNGVISKIIETDKVVIIDIEQKNIVKVVVFDDVDLEEGQYVNVEGKLEEYKGEKEIIADKIEKYK